MQRGIGPRPWMQDLTLRAKLEVVGTILIGTSGFSYEDWRGRFYPKNLPQNRFLTYYAQHFPVCEINFTYYRAPNRRTMENLLRASKGSVEFIVKAPHILTHERPTDPSPHVQAFLEALAPLRERGVLGGILVQFPYSFHATPPNRDYLVRTRELMGAVPLIVELRNTRWISGETFELLRKYHLAFCNVDSPRVEGLVPPLEVVTAPPGYVRFHGRNAEKWWNHTEPNERYDYTYSKAELTEWVPRILRVAQRAPRTYAFFNNHPRAQAVEGARLLRELLGIENLSGPHPTPSAFQQEELFPQHSQLALKEP